MRQTWRWFGPEDNVTLSEIRQAGAQGIVTALYDIKPGDVWPREAIRERRAMIEAAGLTWDVVESLPVSESIRNGAPEREVHFANWITSLKNLAAEGLQVICYNFMPVLDWTRTDLAAPMPSGATALRFDLIDFAAFDLFVLKRDGAAAVVPSPANGVTFCTGSLGARPDNDLPAMIKRLGPHVHFLHLRNVRIEDGTVPGSFHEDDHLGGSTDMIAVIKAVLVEQQRRRSEGRADWTIPMRPDHGQDILDDQQRSSVPGYPAIGRLKGLAELRGAMLALSHGEPT